MKILILGGYGTFGGRLAMLLAEESRVTLLIAGRSLQKAERFCRSLAAGAQKQPLVFDRTKDVEAQLREIQPDLVVDATGPFQVYGNDPYKVVKACIALGVHYMDLADAAGFVRGISQFDAQAKEKNIYILAGVSSFPVLSAAVVRKLSKDLNIESITGGIAPSPYAGVGLNVIRAITAYAGKKIALIRDGKESHGHALTETMRYTVAPPGRIPLNHILFSLVEVPDLLVLSDIWPNVKNIWLGAGPVPEILHRMLIGLSKLVKARIIPTLYPFAPLFHFVINILRWGEHRGGMFISVTGTTPGGERSERSWHLLAESGDGPYIPSMAVQALILKSLDGKNPPVGARPATNELEVEDYENLFKTRTIYTGMRSAVKESTPLYERMLDSALHTLPPLVQQMHVTGSAQGRALVTRGSNPLAHVAALLFGFPKAGADVPLTVTFEKKDGREIWKRDFNGHLVTSHQWHDPRGQLLMERFGPAVFGMALVIENGKLKFPVRKWNLFGIPLPLFLAPKTISMEYEENGEFHFDIEIRHFLTGLIVSYKGTLTPAL